jgi:hypothetical protein
MHASLSQKAKASRNSGQGHPTLQIVGCITKAEYSWF